MPPGAELQPEGEHEQQQQQTEEQRKAGAGVIAWNAAAAVADRDSAARPGKSLDLLLTGLVGAQAWYSRVLERTGKLRSANAVSEETTKGRAGQWIPRSGLAENSVLLERRARPRPESGSKLPTGAIEKTAQKWMDSAYGMHSSVQNTHYGDKIAGHAVIDWGSDIESRPIIDGDDTDTAGSQKPN